MRRVFTLIFVLATCTANGQEPSTAPPVQTTPQPAPTTPETPLPDSPGAVLHPAPDQTASPESVITVAKASFATNHTTPPPCRVGHWLRPATYEDRADRTPGMPSSLLCVDILNPYVRFLDTRVPLPMSPKQKGYLAIRNVSDPFNLATIAATSGFTIAIDSHTAYGPGWKGFGKISGVSLLQDATGEFFGTFLIPSLAHEDPHYRRLPEDSFSRRLVHAISRTVIAQHDDGTPMPNYATLLTYPIASEISNLYVPGIHGNGPSTIARIATGYALDPVNNIVTEFLPDFAKHIHIRVIFVQQILNQVVSGSTNGAQTSP
ncbi:hypothetical protein [Granulicella sp. dw_53]|uniref:hypothetical protein n=1 Tax=Granulicella sp. dw_53 TaxID=2719792 RepID=UPI001BD5F5A6|nr:hypothetical protein [Granulicella sp. dw_53]